MRVVLWRLGAAVRLLLVVLALLLLAGLLARIVVLTVTLGWGLL